MLREGAPRGGLARRKRASTVAISCQHFPSRSPGARKWMMPQLTLQRCDSLSNVATLFHKLGDCGLNLCGQIYLWAHKAGLEPGKHSQKIVCYEDLTVTAASAANSNRWHPSFSGNRFSDRRRDQLKDKPEYPGFIESLCIGN